MSDNFININQVGEIQDEFAQEEDKKKAYQIFALSAIGAALLSTLLYFVALNL